MSSHNNPYGGEVESNQTELSSGEKISWGTARLKYRTDMKEDPKGRGAFSVELGEEKTDSQGQYLGAINMARDFMVKARYFNRPDQTREMVEAVFRGQQKDEQKLFCRAINQVLGLQGEHAITKGDSKDLEDLTKKVSAGIQAKYAGQPNGLEQFLDDIQKPAIGLPGNNPFQKYEDYCKKSSSSPYDFQNLSQEFTDRDEGRDEVLNINHYKGGSGGGRVLSDPFVGKSHVAEMDEETYQAVATAIKRTFADGKVTPEEAKQLLAVMRLIGESCQNDNIDMEEKTQIIGVAKKIGAPEKSGRE